MMDANQKWDVNEAIENMKHLARFRPWWIEEPTSPDDVLGHQKIARSVHPIHVATGEHCQNRVVFKQLMQAGAIGICQIDSCRVGGVNEILAILLMAAKFNIPVCPHAGGVGLCEHVQHLSMIRVDSLERCCGLRGWCPFQYHTRRLGLGASSATYTPHRYRLGSTQKATLMLFC